MLGFAALSETPIEKLQRATERTDRPLRARSHRFFRACCTLGRCHGYTPFGAVPSLCVACVVPRITFFSGYRIIRSRVLYRPRISGPERLDSSDCDVSGYPKRNRPHSDSAPVRKSTVSMRSFSIPRQGTSRGKSCWSLPGIVVRSTSRPSRPICPRRRRSRDRHFRNR